MATSQIPTAPESVAPDAPAGLRARWLPWAILSLSLAGAGALVATKYFGDEEAAQAPKGGPVSVSVEPVRRGPLQVESEYPGEVVAEAADLAAELPARVESIAVELGDRVEVEQALVELDTELLDRERRRARAQARADRAAAKGAEARRDAARRELARGEALSREAVVSEAELDGLRSTVEEAEAAAAAARARAESARAEAALLDAQIGHATIRAPFTGVVARRMVDPGAYVSTGTPVLRLVRAGALRIEFKIPESDIARVDVGDRVQIEARGVAGVSYTGVVARTSGEVQASDRSLLVEARLGPDQAELGALKPGMYAQVRVAVEAIDEALLVPAGAVLERIASDGRRRTGVFVVREDRAVFVDVQLRGRAGEVAAIEAPIELGEAVLVRGHRELADGALVRVDAQARPASGASGASEGPRSAAP